MDNNTLSIYIHELRNQCLHTKAAFDLFNQAMSAQAGPGILYGGQMVLMPASQLSAMLWPARARSRARGESLRKVLQLPEKHPLNDRRLGELWEHMDQKTDEFIAETKGEHVVIDFVGDPASINPDARIEDKHIYRAYNPATHIYYYRGVGYNFQAIANAISELSGRINAVWAQMFPDQAKAEIEYQKQLAEAQKAQAEQAAAPEADKA
ncbi:hypothetical protein GCM10017044_09180 [Kordiimonas sediminis]|uniref:Uncharacterized protein n=1 Tax=Kordiimonas sediminis TaxID=1735581 RepID=A0A919AQI3_9PROT|nr:hypothetical protein [Kordiimonas sediminis]GHF16989.1 hypothetical protein GCM10017044_09180 [Kordiimonas sediminis]